MNGAIKALIEDVQWEVNNRYALTRQEKAERVNAASDAYDKLLAELARLRAVEAAADGMAEALKQSLLPYSNEINILWVRSLSQTALDAYNAALKKPAK